MVVFTCSQCNESLKKNQVEKHFQTRCRNCNMISCVDCGKDFWGDSYVEHIKCISEEEKYSGKNYKPKANANKGEVKQEQWLEKVQIAIDKCITNPRLKGVLERMKDYPNIPRKKAKFENFVSNSMNVRDRRLVGEVWDLLLANTEQPKPVPPKEEEVNSAENGSQKENNVNGNVTNNEQLKELSKKERKAERKRVKNKDENTVKAKKSDSKSKKCSENDKTDSSTENDEKSNKKKSKKRKRKDTEEEIEEVEVKKPHIEEKEEDKTLNSTTEENDDEMEENSPKKKFNWEQTITEVLTSKGEISLKKLKKKVLCEYQAQVGSSKSDERIFAKLNKKISKNPNFVIKKERVKLKNSK
ncbi:cell growth-regulating nucleolar protein-like [Mytilus californianus]|uniref:cell growth-regulating nucleolar protein-like n=1 Tax=Mytilus californianus TaxID=6549 RepID=UPI0022463E49|nr:cell growth-regulating nucleolar protein-like [Mytilus californianus]XP_052100949.1 cell growth-regulating nucleolar protein-like [Mytilus californianus]